MPRTVVSVALLTAVLAGCGRTSPREQVQATVKGFGDAIARRDYQALCDTYFSSRLISGLERAGLPCEAAIRPEIGATRDPTLEIRSITVDGARARVRVHTTAAGQPPSDDTLALVRERGRWRIASLAEAGPQPLAP